MIKKTKVLYVDQALAFGGSVVVISDLLSAIDHEKYEFIFVGEMDIETLQYYFNGKAKIVQIRHLFNYQEREVVREWIFKHLPKYLDKIAIYLISLLAIPLSAIYLLKFTILLIKEKVDIVHLNNGMGNYEAIIASYIIRKKMIAHFHGYGVFRKFHRFFAKKIRYFIAISNFIQNILLVNGLPNEKVKLLPNPVVLRTVAPNTREIVRNKYGILNDEKVFGIVGRIVRWKGHIEFINAAKIVLDSIPESRVMIIGDYSDGDIGYQNKIMGILRDKGIEERIVFTGYVQDIYNLYPALDLLIHTSISPEPFGLVITEAMSQGIPVIASDQGAPKEIIENGIDGLIVNPYDTNALAENIINLLNDAEKRKKMGRLAMEKVLEKYDIVNYAKCMEDIYTKCLTDNSQENSISYM